MGNVICEQHEADLGASQQRVKALEAVITDLLSVMEMQEKRESGAFHITGEVAWGIWSDAKARASETLRGARP